MDRQTEKGQGLQEWGKEREKGEGSLDGGAVREREEGRKKAEILPRVCLNPHQGLESLVRHLQSFLLDLAGGPTHSRLALSLPFSSPVPAHRVRPPHPANWYSQKRYPTTGAEVQGPHVEVRPTIVLGGKWWRRKRRKKPLAPAVAGPPPPPPTPTRPRARPRTWTPGGPPTGPDHPDKWSEVVGRRERRNRAAAAAAPVPTKAAGAPPPQRPTPSGKREGGRRPPRVPTQAAVDITVVQGSQTPYAEVMRRVVAGVKLAEVGITDLRYRKSQTRSSILEVPGPESAAKADAIAARLAEVFRGTDVRLSRPAKTAEMRLAGLDESVTAEAVAAAVVRVGGCAVAEVRCGGIRRNASGLGTA
ncbi:hypothetical protein WN55_03584 [Dufourea novaeangliae]|uniref:Gag-like protein n=1 Tax=Dufourea novaeangliae TaxID=178035 RepID=A0A154PIV0_DUFNO|nr:hypothetical protein WN55_03584 [Dufourea novaeangliae]